MNARRGALVWRGRIAICKNGGGGRKGEDVPSVILLQARYNTPTDAVSRRVAMNEPSTFAFAPWRVVVGQHDTGGRHIEAGR